MATTPTRRRRAAALIASLSAASLILAACGSTTGGSAAGATTQSPDSGRVSSSTPAAAGSDTAADTAAGTTADTAADKPAEKPADTATDPKPTAPTATDDSADSMAQMDMSTTAESGGAAEHSAHSGTSAVSAQIELHRSLRSLWDEHMQFTFDTIVAYATNPAGLAPTLNRLLANQVDLGDAIKPFYGDQAGDALTALLQTHIKDAVPVLDAAKAGDQAALTKAISEWNANAVEIADFLAAANPDQWKQADMREMMKGHISQTVTYASDILTGDWTKAVTDYNTAAEHMAHMADMLANGIIAQFPDKFAVSVADQAKVGLYTAMRGLWDEHMQWTYDTIVAYATNPDGLTPILNRLLANQSDIGAAIEPVYGKAAAAALTALLTTHIKDAVPVLDAAKAGDQAALTKAIDEWNANAVEIGDFLASANPAWGQDEMREMMKGHISQTVAYASDILGGDWAKAIADYDTAHNHMKDMADMLSSGVIDQFPSAF